MLNGQSSIVNHQWSIINGHSPKVLLLFSCLQFFIFVFQHVVTVRWPVPFCFAGNQHSDCRESVILFSGNQPYCLLEISILFAGNQLYCLLEISILFSQGQINRDKFFIPALRIFIPALRIFILALVLKNLSATFFSPLRVDVINRDRFLERQLNNLSL